MLTTEGVDLIVLPSGTAFPFAKCFICGETGHISRACPDNPKGLYPNGKNTFEFFVHGW